MNLRFLTGLLFFFCLLVGELTAIAQIITTIAGNGTTTWGGTNVAATSIGIYAAMINVDTQGNIYNVSYNYGIQKVTPAGIITTVAGNGTTAFSGDGIPATSTGIFSEGVGADNYGNFYIGDAINNRVRKVNSAGIISTIAGTGAGGYSGTGGMATLALIRFPTSIALDKAGNVYFADSVFIQKISTTGIITTIAGTGVRGYTGDGAPATNAQIAGCTELAVDVTGNVYFNDGFHYLVRKIDTFGIITTIAGTGTWGYSGDGGAATAAEFGDVAGVATDLYGNIYISDFDNNVIRKVNAAGIVNTIAGTGARAFSGDGGPAISANLAGQQRISLTPNGDLFIADALNNRIRKITQPGIIIRTTTDTICEGSRVIFTASVSNDASTPVYQWQLNQVNVGTDTATYVTDTLHNGDTINCILTYVFGDTLKKISNSIIIKVDSLPRVSAITAPDTICLLVTVPISDSVTGGTWYCTNNNAGISAGYLGGLHVGLDTIVYKKTNNCGVDSATKIIYVKDCKAGVGELLFDNNILIWPNPNDGMFTLNIADATNEPRRIIITNLLGEKIKEINDRISLPANISLDVPKGVYFVKVITINGEYNLKVVVGR